MSSKLQSGVFTVHCY